MKKEARNSRLFIAVAGLVLLVLILSFITLFSYKTGFGKVTGNAVVSEVSEEPVTGRGIFDIFRKATSAETASKGENTVGASSVDSAIRSLPATYTPNQAVDVSIYVTAAPATLAYGVEETPPAGWGVSDIHPNTSEEGFAGGVYVDGIIKWGPFFSPSKTLTYKTTPPAGESGTRNFSGIANFGGPNIQIGGSSSINRAASVPSAPTGLIASAVSYSQINLAWNSVSGATSYKIYRSTVSNAQTYLTTSTANSYYDLGLNESTTYYYKVSAVNSAGESALSNEASAATPLSCVDECSPSGARQCSGNGYQICGNYDADSCLEWSNVTSCGFQQCSAGNCFTPTPTGLSVSGATQESISLQWNSVSGATYRLYRSSSAGGTYALIASPSTNTHPDSGLTASTTYYYKISAVISSQESAQSGYVSGTTSSKLNPALSISIIPNKTVIQGTATSASGIGCPSGLTCALTRNSVAVSNPDSQTLAAGTYTYVFSTAGNAVYNPASVSEILTVNPAFDFSLANAGTRSVVQGASVTQTISANLTSGATQSVSFSISGLPPGVTPSFSPVSCSPNCATTLTLTASSSAQTGTFIITVTGTSGALTKTTQFNLNVNQALPPAPTGLSATATSSSQINLAWNSVSGATSYKIYRSGVSGGAYALIATSTTNSYPNTGLNAETTYHYKVSAVNSAGESALSNEASATTLPACVNECSAGARQCSGNGYQICGNYDADPCLEWSNVTLCGGGETCRDGRCEIVPTIPAAPSNLEGVAVSYNRIDLSWQDNSNNEEGFKIYRNGVEIAAVGANINNYADLRVVGETEYTYNVRAYNIAGNSQPSNTVSVTTPIAELPPETPDSLLTSSESPFEIIVSWRESSENEDGFVILRADGNIRRFPFAEVGRVGAAPGSFNRVEYIDTGLEPNTRYYYKVYAYNEFGNSGDSLIADGKTKSCPWWRRIFGLRC